MDWQAVIKVTHRHNYHGGAAEEFRPTVQIERLYVAINSESTWYYCRWSCHPNNRGDNQKRLGYSLSGIPNYEEDLHGYRWFLRHTEAAYLKILDMRLELKIQMRVSLTTLLAPYLEPDHES